MMYDSGLDYNLPENHVEKRPGLSEELRGQIFEPVAEGHISPYRGEAEFWLQIHQGLLRTSAVLPGWCSRFLGEKQNERLLMMAPRICDLSQQLVHHAHGHHHIEDDHFFPVFLQAFPQLAKPLDLLEKDHGILTLVLDDIEHATRDFQNVVSNASGRVETDVQSDLMTAAEKLHESAGRLDRLFIRHIGDEEEICLPTLLRM